MHELRHLGQFIRSMLSRTLSRTLTRKLIILNLHNLRDLIRLVRNRIRHQPRRTLLVNVCFLHFILFLVILCFGGGGMR